MSDAVLDAWKNLQSNSKASKDQKVVWIVFKLKNKDIVIDKMMTAAEEAKGLGDEEKADDGLNKYRHKALTDYLMGLKEPRFAGCDFMDKVFFISYIDDKVAVGHKFPYANRREGFKNQLTGITIDLQANSAGELSYESFANEVKKKSRT